MKLRYSNLFFFILLPCVLSAQVLPKEGKCLNYRLVGFAFPNFRHADIFEMQLAIGDFSSEDSFTAHLASSQLVNQTHVVMEMPSFGVYYTWRILYHKRDKVIGNSALFHFNIGKNERVDTSVLRLRIIQPADSSHKDYYVSVNTAGVLYDMKGSPVWYIPDSSNLGPFETDIKFTADSTITFLHGVPTEINLNGDILWKGKAYDVNGKDTTRYDYHHEFTKLANGHYMTMRAEILMCRTVSDQSGKHVDCTGSDKAIPGYKQARFSILTEYDIHGKEVWSWKSAEHLVGSDYDYFSPADTNLKFDPHENSFFFDEDKRVVYLGFRNLNRILKIAYPEGRIIDIYGDTYRPGPERQGDGLFCNPHCPRILQGNELLFFNNNSCQVRDSLPVVVLLRLPEAAKDSIRKLWDYVCSVESGASRTFNSGGSVAMLADQSIFVCMGSQYSKVFIVTASKEEVWSALSEVWFPHEKKWKTRKQDRSAIISRWNLEKLVWKAEYCQ